MRTVIKVLVLALLSASTGLAQNNTVPAGKQQTDSGIAAENGKSVKSRVDPAKEADIRKVLELTGAGALAKQTMISMEAGIRPLMTQALPPGEYRAKLLDRFFEKFHTKGDVQQLIDLAIPLYDKYYTHDEIKGLIQFYETPLGQKTVAVLPNLMAELQNAGKNWGQELGRECMTEVLAENPDLAQALKEAESPAFPK